MDASETMFEKAHQLHHDDGNLAAAVELYRRVVEQYPGTDAASRAAVELASIDELSDEAFEQAQVDAKREAELEPPQIEDDAGFGALRFVGVAFKVLALFNLIAGFVTALVATSDPDIGVSGLAAVLGGVISALVCWGIAEAIRALLSIEDNTRRIARLLEQERDK